MAIHAQRSWLVRAARSPQRKAIIALAAAALALLPSMAWTQGEDESAIVLGNRIGQTENKHVEAAEKCDVKAMQTALAEIERLTEVARVKLKTAEAAGEFSTVNLTQIRGIYKVAVLIRDRSRLRKPKNCPQEGKAAPKERPGAGAKPPPRPLDRTVPQERLIDDALDQALGLPRKSDPPAGTAPKPSDAPAPGKQPGAGAQVPPSGSTPPQPPHVRRGKSYAELARDAAERHDRARLACDEKGMRDALAELERLRERARDAIIISEPDSIFGRAAREWSREVLTMLDYVRSRSKPENCPPGSGQAPAKPQTGTEPTAPAQSAETPEQRKKRLEAIERLRTGKASSSGTEVQPGIPERGSGPGGGARRDVEQRAGEGAPGSAGGAGEPDVPGLEPDDAGLGGTYRLADASSGVTRITIAGTGDTLVLTGMGPPIRLERSGDSYFGEGGVLFGRGDHKIVLYRRDGRLELYAQNPEGGSFTTRLTR